MISGSVVSGQTLESILLGGVKKILGCSYKTCYESVWGDMVLAMCVALVGACSFLMRM